MKVDTRYANKLIGTYVDSTLPWTTYIEQTIHKLSAACSKMRSVTPCMAQKQ